MKQHLGLTAIVLALVAFALFAAMSARAGDRRSWLETKGDLASLEV